VADERTGNAAKKPATTTAPRPCAAPIPLLPFRVAIAARGPVYVLSRSVERVVDSENHPVSLYPRRVP
jgi:hypothetical protein